MANKDINILLAEDEHNNPCDFNKLMSTMEHNYLADTSSVNLEPRGPVSVTNPDYINNLDEPNNYKTETLIYPNNCTVLTESVGLGDNDGKDSNKSDEVKRSSTRKSTRKITSSNQKSEKTGTKLPARKSRRNSGKMLMLDLLAADVRRQQRSEMARKARPSSWGLGGIIDEIFKKNSEMSVDSYENTKSRKSKAGHKRGDRNTDSVNLSIQGENRSLNNGLLLKLKLGTKPILNCQINTIPDMDKDLESFRDVDIETSILQSDVNNNHVKKEVSRVSNDNLVSSKSFLFDTFVAEKEKSQDLTSKIHEITELLEPVENRCSDPGTSPDSEVINVIPDAQISGNTAEEIKISSKDCLSNQLVDCDVLSCEKEIERSWSTGAFMSITNPVSSRNISSREECQLGTLQETEVMVSLDMSTIDSIMKADVSIAEIESVESKSNGQHLQIIPSLKSSENKKTTDCKQNLLQDKSTPMRKVNEKSDTESHPVTGNLEEGSRSTVEPLSNSTMVPSAWVCCDDCHKWRRISAILADSIELTGCRWICKENMDKTFADCSIPQEMSNADINQELELSEASGEEDAPNNHVNSNQLVQKQPTDSYPLQLSWKLIKTNMFLHRNRRSQPMDEVMVCHCKPPLDGRMGCRDECLNRMLNIECVKGTCPCGESCSNQKFQKRKYSKIKCVPSGKKGFGLQLQEDIPRGRFLIEYVGEVLDMPAYEARQKEYASKGHKHFYFMTLNGSEVIDACAKGNLGRFINHSCEPNCRTEKWMVNGEVCIGLFAIRDIKKGEELTFDYNYVRVFGAAAKKCVCGSSRCRGVIGGDPLSDETVVLGDSDDEYPEPVTFYENPSNKFENIISGTPQISEITSKNNSSEFLVAADFENVENSQSQSPDSLLVTDEKNDDSVERELSEIKLENSETLDTCFKVYNNVKSEIIPKDVKDLKKKLKSQTNSKKCTILKPKSRSKLPSSSPLKKWKSKNMQPEMDKKPLIEPQKPKKIVVDNLTGFDAVEEALNSLLNENKGISKRRDASKGYLTLLCLTAYGGNGKGIQSNRDLSMILGALLLTKSRTVLLDIINKNGLQMLHILLKRYKKDFDKTPILRKILKVFEYLAETKILTVETILKPSPHRGESLKESILSLTEHANQQVHQIARSFRDRWIPWSARRVNWAERETERTEYQQNSNFKSYPSQPTNSSDREIKSSEFTDINDTKIVQDSSASCTTDRIRTRKRKSRWDEPGDINSINFTNSIPDLQPPLQNQTKNEDMDMDAPPGFSSTTTNRHKTVMGQPQDRYNSRLPTAFGVPLSVLKKLDTKPESNVSESWVVAPGIKFYPFPPLPVYPRERVPGPFDHNQPGFQYRSPNPNTVDRRYFKQQKWNNNHNSSRSGHPWNPNKYRPAGFNGPKQHYEGGGNGFYQQSHE